MITVFYRIVHSLCEELFGHQQMLHFPMYNDDDQTLMQGQIRFTDHCLSYLPDLQNKRLLDIGCGNGTQTIYIHEVYRPQYSYGVDINEAHIQLAKTESEKRNLKQIEFAIDDSQSLASVADSSFDVAICIESSHHYPDKEAFLAQIRRVLRPGGYFLLADLLSRNDKPRSLWEKKLMLLYWPGRKYREALSRVKLALVKEEDLTDSIIRGFQTADHWFTKAGQTNMRYHLAKLVGRGLIRVNTYQLKHSIHYYLFVARKT